MILQYLYSILVVTAGLALSTTIVPPSNKGDWYESSAAFSPTGTNTDADAVFIAAQTIDQKSAAWTSGPPNQPVSNTAVTSVYGDGLSDVSSTVSRRALSQALGRRKPHRYTSIFNGTGTGPNDRDAAIQGTGYLTFTTVDNSTYNVRPCLLFCDSISTCVFVNLYYEYNNPELDASGSNLKCVAFSDTHTAIEKTDFGGLQLEPKPAGPTYIQQSGGFSSAPLVDPETPEGYELVFGPINGANNAAGYMGFVFLDQYDAGACAQQCRSRDADSQAGPCQYFNLWRAVVDGVPKTYTCSMYFIPTNASTAVNTGQGDLQVTYSRGYKRINLVIDGGFETFNGCTDFCYDTGDATWTGTSAAGGFDDATIFFYPPYAHSGNAVALLGSANGSDSLSGTLTPATPLATSAGKAYSIGFFQASAYAPPAQEEPAFIDVQWNGATVQTIRPGFSNWEFFQVQVTAIGNDVLSFHGGAAPAWTFIDDVTVFEA